MTTAAVTNIHVGTTDLNAIFEGITGTPAAATNIHAGTTDLANIFEPLASGSAAAVTNIHANGVDLNAIFAAIGTVSSYSASPVGGTISRTRSINCYARVRFGSDGIEYWTVSSGGAAYSQDKGAWMDTGANTNYWVERTINSGTLQTDSGAGRLAMTVNRDFGCLDTTDNGIAVTANVTFRFYDAASGGNQVGSATYDFSAFKDVPL